MDKAEQPTIEQARYTVADYELAEQCVSAANVVTCDGYYEVDIEKVAETLAKARTTSLAAQEALAGYRAAVSFISADSWDGCSDCINILKAARCADMTDAMTINETAEHLKRIRLHYDPAALPPAPSPPAQDGLVEAFYIDCEFDGHNGSLLSIALVGDTDSIHIKTTAPARDDWVLQNVLPLMDMHNAPKSASVSLNDVGSVIRAFLGDCKCPVIIADSPVDIGRFCRALSTSTDGQWASTDFPAMRFEVHNVDCYPTTLEGAVQHNAWWDAMALKAALSAIKEQHHD